MKLSIIVADDKVINIEVMKVNMDSLNVAKSVEYCYDGNEALKMAIN
jgi:CheY-like chemotaxis protein